MSVIQVDPRVQALFDQNLAQTRRRGEEITGNLRAEQQRIAAQLRENTEKFARQREEIKGQLAQLDQQKEQPKRASNPWAKPAQGDGNELSFATEDDDPGHAVPPPVSHQPQTGGWAAPQAAPQPGFPPQPAAAPPAPLPPRQAPPRRRPIEDDDEDMSGQSWLS
ncbi:hypothetical protein [Goodfellowiella coeruleoviolacea]|nr:hypothetical protein [Goodfellowiella coeruleoviolacea]